MTVSQNQIPKGEWISNSAAETFDLGERIGSLLVGGEILLLSGPLGAGKTVFVKGLASALDIDPAEVTSPSFTLVNPYSGRLPFYHIDLYRLENGVSAAHAVGSQGTMETAANRELTRRRREEGDGIPGARAARGR